MVAVFAFPYSCVLCPHSLFIIEPLHVVLLWQVMLVLGGEELVRHARQGVFCERVILVRTVQYVDGLTGPFS